MPDICDLILDDHETFRRRFAELDEQRDDEASLARLWPPLALRLDLHAAAEEAVFYPCLLREGSEGDEETADAIDDHNKIRDAVRAANDATVGSNEWWSAVRKARKTNSDHMAEEERGALADYRSRSDAMERRKMADQFDSFKERHSGGRGLEMDNRDADRYIAEHHGSRFR